MKTALIVLLASVALYGCSSFLHFSDPTLEDAAAKFCGEKAEAHRAELEAESKRVGLGIDDLLLVFRQACLLRLKKAQEGGEVAGLSAARAKIEAAQ